MNPIKILILCAAFVVFLGNAVYVLVLFPHRLQLTERQEEILKEKACGDYIGDLKEKLQRVNGWLYELIFFSCVHYCLGLSSLSLSLLSFLASSVENSSFYVQLCSVCAAISSCVVLFMNPLEKHRIAQDAWVNGSSLAKGFLLRFPSMDKNTLLEELVNLHEQISLISKEAKL